MIYVFEGKSYDLCDINLSYNHSLSLHETLDGAIKALDWEKKYLMSDDGFILKEYKKIDEHGEISVECILQDEFLNERKLTVNQWSVLK
jgi:hypothetical protein